MKITHVRINALENPIGFFLSPLRCSWQIQDTDAAALRYLKIEVASDPQFSAVLLEKEGAALDPCGTVLPLTLSPCTRYWLRIQAEGDNGETALSRPVFFETGKLRQPWQAQWITTQEEDRFHPAFHKGFSAEGVCRARLYIAGLGLFRAYLNGTPIGDEVLTPYYSDYHTECQYMTYDITPLLHRENQLQVELGNGWYKGRFGLGNRRESFGNRFLMIAEIHLEDASGNVTVIPSDGSWSYCGSDTAISDIYDGETLDRLLWDGKPNPEKKAVPTRYCGNLVERRSLPVKEQETLPVKQVLHTPLGETVLDFGQNFAGYPVFYSDLPKGTKITLDFGEILQDGNFCNANYRTAKSQFVYRSGGQPEWVRPRFTFFGFRYIRVTGWPGTLSPERFAGKALYSDMEETGSIVCGIPEVNRLFQNVLWGQKSNFIDFPTDCPQRDERLGWTGDAQVFSETGCYNMDAGAFYGKFLHDLRLSQQQLGGILPGMIPVFEPERAICSAVWGDLATILPTVLYRHYGDLSALERDYPMMKDWVDYIDRMDAARGRQYRYNFGNQLGDWLALDGRTEQSSAGGTDAYFIASCYYANSLNLTADAAAALGKPEEEAHYRNLAQAVRARILEDYFSPSGRLCVDTQTGYILALAFGIWRNRDTLIEGLRTRFYRDSYRLTGGFVGAPLLCRVLAENGMAEEAYYFLLQKDYPGWMHCIALGATTVWERWNSVLDDGHLSGTSMNSLNHYSFGAVVQFLYRDVMGLQPLSPGFRRARIAPLVRAEMRSFDGSYRSPYGVYRCRWELNGNNWKFFVEIPFGCTAQIVLPNGKSQEVFHGKYAFSCPASPSDFAFGIHTPFKMLLNRPDALEAIGRISPILKQGLLNRDPDLVNNTIEMLKFQLPYMGFTPEVRRQLKETLQNYYRGNI